MPFRFMMVYGCPSRMLVWADKGSIVSSKNVELENNLQLRY